MTIISEAINIQGVVGMAFYDTDAKEYTVSGVVVSNDGKITHIISCPPETRSDADWPAEITANMQSGYKIEIDGIRGFGRDSIPTLQEFLGVWCRFDTEKSKDILDELQKESRETIGERSAQETQRKLKKLMAISVVQLTTGEDSKKNVIERIKREVDKIWVDKEASAMMHAGAAPEAEVVEQKRIFDSLTSKLLARLALYATEKKFFTSDISDPPGDDVIQQI